MRRMYGNLVVQQPADIPEQPKTPASTILFPRSVRQFGRFKRSASEGYLEDFLIDEPQDDEDDFWNLLLTNTTLLAEFNKTATPQDMEIFNVLADAYISHDRPRRQAGFPGATSKPDNKLVD